MIIIKLTNAEQEIFDRICEKIRKLPAGSYFSFDGPHSIHKEYPAVPRISRYFRESVIEGCLADIRPNGDFHRNGYKRI